jgi:cellulose synthase/poly-beta-1,6-N-acetylglucosamine synthase-like glycosyltransferase
MTANVEWFLIVASLLLVVPAGMLFTQVLLSLGEVPEVVEVPLPRPRLAVLIPAHDEATVIAETLCSILPQLSPDDRLIVVADNCSDGTAAIAASMGAEVTSRWDTARRGKGYALDYGLYFLKQSGLLPEVVVVMDADCDISGRCLDVLAGLCVKTGRPIQAHYSMMLPRQRRGLFTEISAVAWRLKNFVRPLGFGRLGLPCFLYGSGMAFPWHVITSVELATGEVVEDLKLGIDLALKNHFTLFCPQALVTSRFPDSAEAAHTQRTRWEHGYLRTILRYTPVLLYEGLRQKSWNLLAMMLDLCVPPLALLVLLALGLLGSSAIFLALTGVGIPFAFSLFGFGVISIAVLLAWARHGRDIISFGKLMLAPVYVLAKIPVYVKFFVNRQRNWVKTRRE